GTAAVGVASGKGDAAVFLAGAGAGSLLFAAIEPRLRHFLHGGEQPSCSLAELVGLGALPGALALLGIAVAASVAATRIERLVARRQS
ncbi:MAG TPA: hypothetical protein VFT55_18090, partial [Planctomycetota bacterium]|nr:hypothetical protein [Planctomycetota bacterium]